MWFQPFILTEVRGFKIGTVTLGRRAGGEAVGGGAWEAISRRQRAIQRGEAPAGVEQVGLFGDFPEQGAALLTEKTKKHHSTGRIKACETLKIMYCIS